jgi:Family of unknown function (DUF6220)
MRRASTLTYGYLAALFVLAVILQVFLAGLGIFGAKSFSAHKDFGWILHTTTIVLFLLSIAGPRTRADMGMAFGLFALCTVQVSIVGDSVREDAPGVAALHPVLALFILGLAGWIAWRTLGRSAAGPGPRAPATAGP